MSSIYIRIVSNIEKFRDALVGAFNKAVKESVTDSLKGVEQSVDKGGNTESLDALFDIDDTDESVGVGDIRAKVSMLMADEILRRAKDYCPVDTGNLRNSGKIINNGDGTCDVVFDCDYAWYVHERMGVYHEPPTCAKFLTLAVQEVEAIWNVI